MNLYAQHTHPEMLDFHEEARTRVPFLIRQEISFSELYEMPAEERRKKFGHLAGAFSHTAEDADWFAYWVAQGRYPAGEAAIAKDARRACRYAKLTRQRFPAGEAAIASDAACALQYATDVIKGRWPEGETAIASSAFTAMTYIKNVLHGPMPEAIPAIATMATTAYDYAMFTGERFPDIEGERLILSSEFESSYRRTFNLPE